MAKPVAKFRAGQVSAAIWENEITVNGKKAVMLKASVERRFKDKDGQWKSSNSFSRNEIPSCSQLGSWGTRRRGQSLQQEHAQNGVL